MTTMYLEEVISITTTVFYLINALNNIRTRSSLIFDRTMIIDNIGVIDHLLNNSCFLVFVVVSESEIFKIRKN
jgi:hypothetical protein